MPCQRLRSTSASRLGGLLALGQPGIERTADHARIGRLRIAQLPRLVDCLAVQAEVRNGCWAFPTGTPSTAIAWPGHLAPLLGSVALIREPALGLD